jgi:redox-sensitive bicupin YhaK (pirin superfamily)
MSVRVVLGEIGAKDATTRTVLPTVAQPKWAPFLRVAETIATPRRRFPPHGHEGVEVLTHVIEGSGTYECSPNPPEAVGAGSTTLLTAPIPVLHAINPGKGQMVRWFAVVVTLPAGAASAPRVQFERVEGTAEQPDGTIVRRLVGPGATIKSAVGLEAESVEFRTSGASFRKVGHDRVAVCYALSGRGTVDNDPLDGGEAALVEDAAGIALQGQPGFRFVLVSAPRKS